MAWLPPLVWATLMRAMRADSTGNLLGLHSAEMFPILAIMFSAIFGEHRQSPSCWPLFMSQVVIRFSILSTILAEVCV